MTLLNPPIFLVGAERSGTTLLRLMLSHHPEITFLSEFEFIVDDISPSGKLPEINEFLYNLQRNRIFNDYHLSIDKTLSYKELITSFLLQLQKKQKKTMTPYIGATIHRNFQHLKTIWPSCRFIHLVRDARDVATSNIKMNWEQTYFHAVKKWIDTEETWNHLLPVLKSPDYIEVKYENFVVNPDESLSKICQWIGVTFHPALHDYTKTSTYTSPDPKRVNNWKRVLTPRQIQQVESIAADLLVDRNYELSGIPRIKVGFFKKIYLNIVNKLKKIYFRNKRYGFKLYLASLLVKVFPNEKWQQNVREKLWKIDRKHLK